MNVRTRTTLALSAAILGLLASACVEEPGGEVQPPAPPSEVILAVGSENVVFSVPTGLSVSVSAANLATLPALPGSLETGLGAFKIDVAGVTPGAVARVTVKLPRPASGLLKLIGGAWTAFLPQPDGTGVSSVDNQTYQLDLRDGGRGDNDGVADGRISDPVVPVIPPPPPPPWGTSAAGRYEATVTLSQCSTLPVFCSAPVTRTGYIFALTGPCDGVGACKLDLESANWGFGLEPPQQTTDNSCGVLRNGFYQWSRPFAGFGDYNISFRGPRTSPVLTGAVARPAGTNIVERYDFQSVVLVEELPAVSSC